LVVSQNCDAPCVGASCEAAGALNRLPKVVRVSQNDETRLLYLPGDQDHRAAASKNEIDSVEAPDHRFQVSADLHQSFCNCETRHGNMPVSVDLDASELVNRHIVPKWNGARN
jgi:hypothetical protein